MTQRWLHKSLFPRLRILPLHARSSPGAFGSQPRLLSLQLLDSNQGNFGRLGTHATLVHKNLQNQRVPRNPCIPVAVFVYFL